MNLEKFKDAKYLLTKIQKIKEDLKYLEERRKDDKDYILDVKVNMHQKNIIASYLKSQLEKELKELEKQFEEL